MDVPDDLKIMILKICRKSILIQKKEFRSARALSWTLLTP